MRLEGALARALRRSQLLEAACAAVQVLPAVQPMEERAEESGTPAVLGRPLRERGDVHEGCDDDDELKGSAAPDPAGAILDPPGEERAVRIELEKKRLAARRAPPEHQLEAVYARHGDAELALARVETLVEKGEAVADPAQLVGGAERRKTSRVRVSPGVRDEGSKLRKGPRVKRRSAQLLAPIASTNPSAASRSERGAMARLSRGGSARG